MVKSKNFVYTAQQQNMVRHMISLIQSIRRKTLLIFDDIDATSFGFQEFLNVLIEITKISSRYTNKHGFLIMQLLQRSSIKD